MFTEPLPASHGWVARLTLIHDPAPVMLVALRVLAGLEKSDAGGQT